MKLLLRTSAVAVSAIVAVSLSSCAASSGADGSEPRAEAGACAPLSSETTVSIASTQGIIGLVVNAIKDEGFDKKYKLDLDVKDFLNPPAMQLALNQGSIDVGFGGVTAMAIARDQGSDVVFIGSFATPANGVFVSKSSDIHDLSDLKGRRLGSFSGTNSATTAILGAIASDSYGIPDLTTSGNLVVAPDAALSGLLDKGEIDAYLAGTTATVEASLSDDYREIADLASDYKAATGSLPIYLAPATTDAYADQHCSELRAFSSALRDGVEYVRSEQSAWSSYAKELGMTDADAATALRERLGSTLTTDWGEPEIDGMKHLITSLMPILGDDFVTTVPDGLFSTEYSPL